MKPLVCIISIFVLCFSSSHVLAESPTSDLDHEEIPIVISSEVGFILVDRSNAEPQKMEVKFVTLHGDKYQIAEFYQDGPALPELVSVFRHSLRSREVMFLIVRWHYYLPGVDTEGDYYEVHAYAASYNAVGTLTFKVDEHLSKIFGSGMDGRQEGVPVRFKFKDATSIRKKLSKLN